MQIYNFGWQRKCLYNWNKSGQLGAPLNPYVGWEDAFLAQFIPGTPDPDIDAKFKNIIFADGSTTDIGVKSSSIILGREFPITIENLVAGPLQLTGSSMVSLSGPQAAHFYVSQQPSSPIVAYGTTTFKLRTVRDSMPGFLHVGWTYPVSMTVNIPNDDPDENPYDFTINFTL